MKELDAADARAVKMGMTQDRGRGLFATRAMDKGEIVLIERPLVAMQSLDNTQDVMVCRNCLGFVGDVLSQLELLSGVPRHECLQKHRQGASAAAEEDNRNATAFSGVHDCVQGCGEVYCSPECRQEHYDRCHQLLCVGPIPEEEAPTHPLVAFRVHAMQTNEIFLLVGEVIARIVSMFFQNDGDLEAAMAPFADFVQEPWWEVAVSRKSDAETGFACESEPSSETLPYTLRTLCEESCDLLRSALGAPPQLNDILCTRRFGQVVGMFEQNNVGIRAQSPISKALKEVIALRVECQENGESAARQFSEEFLSMLAFLVNDVEQSESSDDCDGGKGCGFDHDHQQHKGAETVVERTPEELSPSTGENNMNDPMVVLKQACDVADGDEGSHTALFAPLDGTALYALICCMNHSCRPNCTVRYPGTRATVVASDHMEGHKAEPLLAEVVLLENVKDGDELTQSYVDRSMNLVDRRNALEDYGFVCRCPRCTEEAAASDV